MCEENEWYPTETSCKQLSDDIEKVKFVYELAQEKLGSTIESHTFIEKKILILLSYLIATDTFLIGYLVKNYDKLTSFFCQNIPFYYHILAIIIIVSIISAISAWLLKAQNFYLKGNEPSNLMTENCTKDSLIDIMISEIIWREHEISKNENIVKRNSNFFNFFLFPIVLIISISFLFPEPQTSSCQLRGNHDSVFLNYFQSENAMDNLYLKKNR